MTKTKDSRRYDVAYRRPTWRAGLWRGQGHRIAGRAHADRLARGAALIEPEFVFKVVTLP